MFLFRRSREGKVSHPDGPFYSRRDRTRDAQVAVGPFSRVAAIVSVVLRYSTTPLLCTFIVN